MNKQILDQTPPEEYTLLQKRIQLWNEYDLAIKHASELTELARQISPGGPSEQLSSLTGQNTPPTELAQAVSEAQKELKRIAAAKQSIQNSEEEIQRIKSQRTTMIMVAVAIVIIVILILVL